MGTRGIFLFVSIVVVLTMTLPALSQTTTGVILGDITDKSGARLPGVTVKAVNQATGVVREAITDEYGSYRFPALMPADYNVTAELSGFTTLTRQNIKLPVATQVKIDFRMDVATIAENITVTEQAPLVETTENSLKTFIDSQRIEELPLKSRDFLELAMLAPGVVQDSSAAGANTDSISFGGMGEAFKSVWLEGVDFNDEVTGGGTNISSATRTAIAQETIQEFQVMSNSYSAEFGRSASGAINVVTKSGGNDFHGNAFYFRRDDAFDKPNYFAKEVPPFKTHQIGGTAGGPIQKDRIFYFASYERKVNDKSAQIVIPTTLVNFAQQLGYDTRTSIEQPERFNNYFVKFNYAINKNHSAALTYTYDKRSANNIEAGGATTADGGYLEGRFSHFGVLNITSLLSSRMVNELRLNFSNQALYRGGTISGGDPGSLVGRPTLSFPGVTFGNDNTQGRSQKNYILSDGMSYHLGKHDFKFGGEMNRVPTSSEINVTFQGRYTFLRDEPVVPGNNATLPTVYTQTVLIRPNIWSDRVLAGIDRSVNIYAMFVNDTWRLRPNLTLNLGVRYDVQYYQGDLKGQDFPSTWEEQARYWVRLVTGDLKGQNFKPLPPDTNNFSPRVGVSWDPRNNGKMVVRFGYGVYYDQITTNGLRGIINSYPGFTTTEFANDTRLTGIPNSFFPARPPLSALSEQGSTSFSLPNGARVFPYTQQFTGGLSRQLGNDYKLSADFIHMLGLHFSRTMNVNACSPCLPTSARRYPLVSSGTRMNLDDSGNNTAVNMFQTQLQKRMSNRLSFLIGYTLGSVRSFSSTDNYNLSGSEHWGPTSNDVRHRVVGNFLTQLPFGIAFGSVASINSAPPYNITTGRDDNGDGATNDRPAGTGPNAGRGDPYFQFDLRSSKRFATSEHTRLEVLWEMFNVFNTVNFANYNGNQASTTFGQPRFAFDPFQGQLGIKFTF